MPSSSNSARLLCVLHLITITLAASFLVKRPSLAPFAPIYGHVAVPIPQGILIVGGFAQDRLADVWRSDDSGFSWKKISSMPTQISAAPALYFEPYSGTGDLCVVYGGMQGSAHRSNTIWASTDRGLNWFEIFNTDQKWSQRFNHGAVRIVSAMTSSPWTLVMGGTFDGSVYFNDVWLASSPDSGMWQRIQQFAPWKSRSGMMLTSFSHSSRVILAGGVTEGLITVNDVWMATFDSSNTLNWTPLTDAAPWLSRSYGNLVNMNENLFLTAGLSQQGKSKDVYLKNDVWASVDGGSSWLLISAAATFSPRCSAACFAVGNEIVLIGGAWTNPPQTQYLDNDVWAGFVA